MSKGVLKAEVLPYPSHIGHKAVPNGRFGFFHGAL